MGEVVRVLGIDPSLRNTGVSIVSYNSESGFFNKPSHCQVLVNPPKYKGTEAILNMLDMIEEMSKQDCYKNVDAVIVESPPAIFNSKFPTSTLATLGHISGGAVALLGLSKSYLFKPTEWNKSRKKDVTHTRTIAELGNSDEWHYEVRVKSEKYMEHILDATSMALWWIKENYVDEE